MYKGTRKCANDPWKTIDILALQKNREDFPWFALDAKLVNYSRNWTVLECDASQVVACLSYSFIESIDVFCFLLEEAL